MALVELTGLKGEAVWVNPTWVVCIGAVGGGGGSMYGDNNVRSATKLQFLHGTTIEVKEAVADVVSLLAAA
jgi:uncharacterized protein YlzI (FlbEa/FlbD family)